MWWWYGRGVTQECLSIQVHACKELNGLVPAHKPHRLDCPDGKSPTPVPSEGRFQASPVQTSPNPKSKKKIARLAHLTSLFYGGRGAQSFPSPRRWVPWIRKDLRRCTLACLPGKPDPFTHITTCICKMTRSNKPPLPTTITYPGSRPRGETHGEKISAVSELQSAI